MNLKIAIFVFLKNRIFKNKLYQAVTFRINDYLEYVNSKILFLLIVYEYFQNNVQLLANEFKRYITTSS